MNLNPASDRLCDRLLRQAVLDAIIAQDDEETALAIAEMIDAGHVRTVSRFRTDSAGKPMPATLLIDVELPTPSGWRPLLTVGWRRLGLEWADVLAEVAWVRTQGSGRMYPDDHDAA